MRNIINRNQITDVHIQDKIPFWKCQECDWRLSRSKGEEIFYFFGRFGRPKYYKEDLYRKIFSFDETLYTFEEMKKDIRENYDFEKYHLFEEDGVIYKKPHIVFSLSNGNVFRKYLDSKEECDQYLTAFMVDNNFLIEI